MAAPLQLRAILDGPALLPPLGVDSNFINPPNLTLYATIAIGLGVFLSTLCIILRMYTKLFIIRSVAYEDYALLTAWVGQLAATVPSALIGKHGGGVHMWDIQLKTFHDLLYWLNVDAIVCAIVIFFIKLSLLLQLRRIFVPNWRANLPLFIGISATFWASLIFSVSMTVFFIATCTPREKIWNPTMATGFCFNVDAMYQASALFALVTDSVIFALPMPSVWKLQLSPKKKIGMVAIFATGFLVCITSIMRVYTTWTLVQSSDVSYNAVVMGLWTIAGIYMGIIVSCLPVLPRFFRVFGPRVYKNFPFISKMGSRIESEPGRMGLTNERVVSSKFKQHSGKQSAGVSISEEWGIPYSQRIGNEGKYHSLGELDPASLAKGITRKTSPAPADGTSDTNIDLKNQIHVMHEMHVEIEPNTDGLITADLHEQGKGW